MSLVLIPHKLSIYLINAPFHTTLSLCTLPYTPTLTHTSHPLPLHPLFFLYIPPDLYHTYCSSLHPVLSLKNIFTNKPLLSYNPTREREVGEIGEGEGGRGPHLCCQWWSVWVCLVI